jgi:predicted nucleic acid-binding protein
MAGTGGTPGLIDTDIVVDAARQVREATAFLGLQRAMGGIRVSTITAMELVSGCRNALELARLQQFAAQLTLVPVTAAASQKGYDLMQSFFLSHGLLIPDALIAATALVEQLPLYTRNVRHFRMIPTLTVRAPY